MNLIELKATIKKIVEEHQGAPLSLFEDMILDLSISRATLLIPNWQQLEGDAADLARVSVLTYRTTLSTLKPIVQEIMKETDTHQLTVNFGEDTFVISQSWAGSAPPA